MPRVLWCLLVELKPNESSWGRKRLWLMGVCLPSVLEVVVERGDIGGSMKDTLSVMKA